jgi:hypothetical protein
MLRIYLESRNEIARRRVVANTVTFSQRRRKIPIFVNLGISSV